MRVNQIKKRLEIIKIAISMTDSETIRLQLLKLEPFEIDPKLDEIIDLLKMKNYAQAQYLITDYINPAKIIEEEAEKPKTKPQEKIQKEKRYSILEEFQILMPTNKNIEEEEDEEEQDESSYEVFPPHKVLLEIRDEEDEFDEKEHDEDLDKEDIETDEEEIADYDAQYAETENNEEINEEERRYGEEDSIGQDEEIQDTQENDAPFDKDENTSEEEDDSDENELDERRKPTPIRDIQERFEQIYGVYNFAHETDTRYQSTKIWITQIKNRGVTNSSLQAMLQHIENLKGRDDTSEAAQLICVCAATNLQLGRLLLARELYRGKLVAQDEVEAYKIIHELAEEDYNEALCDLGQFYEFGVAVSKNEKKAKELYEKAIQKGLQRARPHLERVSKKSGIFSKMLQ